jgi:hypothetical protein
MTHVDDETDAKVAVMGGSRVGTVPTHLSEFGPQCDVAARLSERGHGHFSRSIVVSVSQKRPVNAAVA